MFLGSKKSLFLVSTVFSLHTSCKTRTSFQESSASKQSQAASWFSKEKKVEIPMPADFLTQSPKIFDKSKCDFIEPDAGSELSKIAQSAGSKFKIVRSDYIPFCMKYFNSKEGFPENLQGIWWMNGNPIPEVLLTFAHADWNTQKKTTYLKPNFPGAWSWVANDKLGANFLGGKKTDATVEIVYDIQNLNKTQPMKSFDTKNGEYKQTPDILWKYTIIDPLENPKEGNMKKISGAKPVFESSNTTGSDALVRRTQWLGVVSGDYTLTRIVDGKGNILEKNYAVYLEFLKEKKHWYSGILVDYLFDTDRPKQ